MLMQPRHPFPLPFDAGATPDSSPASTFFDTQPYSGAEPTPTNFVQNSFLFSDPFAASPTFYLQQPTSAYEGAAQSMAARNQPHTQDWQMFGDASSSSSRPSQSSQPPRKRFRMDQRSLSSDLSKSPNAYSQHLSTSSQNPSQPAFLDASYYNSGRPAQNAMAAALSMNSALDHQFGNDSDMPGYAHSTGHSVSSYGHDSPATPRTVNGEDRDDSLSMGHTGESYSPSHDSFLDDYSLFDDYQDLPNVPKFERTISDIYNDELFSSASYTSNPSTKYMPVNSSLLSPYRSSMSERLQAANQARSVSPLDTAQRRPSPFRQGSPFAAPADFGHHMSTAAGVRQQQKAEADALAYQQHHPRPNNAEPPTISPKDAVLEFHEDPSNLDAPMYPASSGAESSQRGYSSNMANSRSSQFSMPTSDFPSFLPHSLPTGSSGEIPLYLSSSFRPTSSSTSMPEVAASDYPARLLSMETSASASASETGADNNTNLNSITSSKPAGAQAGRGGYTCTAPGCTQRFESPGRLTRHRRESHRSGSGSGSGNQSATVAAQAQQQQQQQQQQKVEALSPRSSGSSAESDADAEAEDEERIGSGMTSAALMQRNAQAGPHRCSRVNPSTGKPCNTVFSRPYDLTRHEDTIHNGRQKKVRCHLCTEEKTFSRSDALTRHMRVVHPEIDFPGKHRRRHV